LNTHIDDELDTPNEFVPDMRASRMLNTRSRRFKSTGFENYYDESNAPSRAQTANVKSMRSTKYMVKSLKQAGTMRAQSMIKFGSSKNIRKKMSKINK